MVETLTPVSTLIAITLALSTTAPMGSVTVPVMSPVMVWDPAVRPKLRNNATGVSRSSL